MSALLLLQIQFSQDISALIRWAYIEHGYGVTLGEALRTQTEALEDAARGCGIKNSLHLEKLALDINLFKKENDLWVYIENNEGHEQLGAWWKTLGVNHRWGGDFPKKDFNHYSISPDGIRG